MKKKNGAKRHPFGIGILYVMVHVPILIFTKIGITGVGVGKRAKSIDADMPGFPIPIAFVPLPFVFQVEQALHYLCAPIRVNFYKGSGHTEWFFFLAALPALCVISGTWYFYFWAFDQYFGTRLTYAVVSIFVKIASLWTTH